MLVGTQMDLRDDPEQLERLKQTRTNFKVITQEMGQKLAQEMSASVYLECSALTQQGVKDVFDEAINAALEPPKKKGKKCSLL